MSALFHRNGHRAARVAEVAAAAVVVSLAIALLPDLLRYIKITTM